MRAWWIRPGVRLLAAAVLPFAVPAIITMLIWALPGDPAEIICPPETCGGTAELAARWNLDAGPWKFFSQWVRDALGGEFGNSWRVEQGLPVRDLLNESVPTTLKLVLFAFIPLLLGSAGAATGLIPAKADGVFAGVGLVPAVVFALMCSALVELNFGSSSFSDEANLLRLGLGALVLGLADGAFASAVSGVRSLFSAERNQRYVQIAIMRGEEPLSNMLPNVSATLAGQLRARVLHLLSGAVIVEVVLRINGVGDLLWAGTLLQDFGVVLAAATTFACISAGLLVIQALIEIAVAMHVRRAPVLSEANPPAAAA